MVSLFLTLFKATPALSWPLSKRTQKKSCGFLRGRKNELKKGQSISNILSVEQKPPNCFNLATSLLHKLTFFFYCPPYTKTQPSLLSMKSLSTSDLSRATPTPHLAPPSAKEIRYLLRRIKATQEKDLRVSLVFSVRNVLRRMRTVSEFGTKSTPENCVTR